MSTRSTEMSKQKEVLFSQYERSLSHFGVFRKQKEVLLSQYERSPSHFGVFRKRKEVLLSQTPVCLPITVFSASKMC